MFLISCWMSRSFSSAPPLFVFDLSWQCNSLSLVQKALNIERVPVVEGSGEKRSQNMQRVLKPIPKARAAHKRWPLHFDFPLSTLTDSNKYGVWKYHLYFSSFKILLLHLVFRRTVSFLWKSDTVT